MPSVGALLSAREHPAHITAKLQATDLDALELDLQSEGWKITSGTLDPYEQITPRRALYSFIKALDEGRVEILWNFIPLQYAEQMTLEDLRKDLDARAPELKILAETLRRNRTNPIEIAGDHAYMRYGDRQVVFRLEDDVWKIEDPDG